MYLHKNIFLEDPPGVPIEILSWRIAHDLSSHCPQLDFVNYGMAQGAAGGARLRTRKPALAVCRTARWVVRKREWVRKRVRRYGRSRHGSSRALLRT